jgi:hypothetical protein
MSLVVTSRLAALRNGVPRVQDYIERKQEINDYGVYLRLMKKIHRE